MTLQSSLSNQEPGVPRVSDHPFEFIYFDATSIKLSLNVSDEHRFQITSGGLPKVRRRYN